MTEQWTTAKVRQHVQQLRQAEMNVFADELEAVLNAAVVLWRARYTDREMILRQAAVRFAESNDMELSEDEIRQHVLNDLLLSNLAWLEEDANGST